MSATRHAPPRGAKTNPAHAPGEPLLASLIADALRETSKAGRLVA